MDLQVRLNVTLKQQSIPILTPPTIQIRCFLRDNDLDVYVSTNRPVEVSDRTTKLGRYDPQWTRKGVSLLFLKTGHRNEHTCDELKMTPILAL
ncbi:hypothetical protein PM082_005878 [Marasmius tenuissimus]|nr:hypothetical protein PM082_005878 [Marasmius tenuissimus]